MFVATIHILYVKSAFWPVFVFSFLKPALLLEQHNTTVLQHNWIKKGKCNVAVTKALSQAIYIFLP